MKKKAYERQLARTRAIFPQWIRMLGLSAYDICVNYFDNEKDWRDGHKKNAALTVQADWRYMIAMIDVNVPIIATMSDEALERKCVHELCHVLVNEMHRDSKVARDHEERTVEQLAKAFIWTRNITRDANTHNHE